MDLWPRDYLVNLCQLYQNNSVGFDCFIERMVRLLHGLTPYRSGQLNSKSLDEYIYSHLDDIKQQFDICIQKLHQEFKTDMVVDIELFDCLAYVIHFTNDQDAGILNYFKNDYKNYYAIHYNEDHDISNKIQDKIRDITIQFNYPHISTPHHLLNTYPHLNNPP